MTRPTATQLYNAGIAMNLAKGTSEHRARVDQFVSMFIQARPWIKVIATARIAAWRYSPRRVR